jgi:hypothetical protein
MVDAPPVQLPPVTQAQPPELPSRWAEISFGRPTAVEPYVRFADIAHMDWEALTNAELLALSGGALAELRERDVVRTANAPAGDLAERLVADAMRGNLAPNGQKSWDVLVRPSVSDTPAQRVQVKARVVTDPANAGQRQVSAFRSWDFESVMFVLFDPMYRVRAAALVPAQLVREQATHVEFTASDRVFASEAMLALGENWTERLQTAELWAQTRQRQSGPYTDLEEIGPTPAGGVRSVLIVDGAGRIVEITEYDADGRAIMRSYGAPTHHDPVAEMFRELDLPAPSIPGRFAPSLQALGQCCVASNDVSPAAMYLFETEFLMTLVTGQVGDFVAVSHAGHGANSYALSYFLVDGPLALFLQIAWGGVYTDTEKAASAWRMLISHVERLIRAAQSPAAVAACGRRERLLVVNSDFRGGGSWALCRPPLDEGAVRALLERHLYEETAPGLRAPQQSLMDATAWAESVWIPA